MSKETVRIVTADGVVLAGDLYAAGDGPVALLLHMMPSDRSSWRTFAPMLIERGFGAVLAIDERGHGDSLRGPEGATLDYRAFTDEQQQAKTKDVDAGVGFLRERTGDAPLALVGASIGANLSIVYGAAHPEVAAVVALSPGLDYCGVTTAQAMPAFEGRPLLLAASEEDERSMVAVNELGAARPDAETVRLQGAGHGTTMFERDAAFAVRVADWLAAAVERTA